MILLFVIVLFFSHDLFASSNEKDLNEIMKAEYIDLCKNNQKFTPNNYLNYLNEGIKKSDLNQANLWSDKIKHFLTKGIIGAIKLKFIKHDGSDNHKNILSTIDDALIASQKIDLLNVNQAKKSFRADFIFDHSAVALDDLSGNVSSFLSVDSQQNDLDWQKNAYKGYIKRLTTVATATERYLWNANAENNTLQFLVKSKLKEEQYALLRDQLFDSDYINFLLEDILIEKIKSTEYFWFDSLIEKLYQLQLKYKKGNIEKYKDSDQLVHYGSSGHNNQCGFFSSFCRDVPLEITNVLNNIQIDSCKKEIEEIKVNLNKDKKNVIELIKKLLNNKNLNFQHKKDLQTILGILLASPQVYDAISEYINLVNDLDDEFILKFVLAYTGNGLTGVAKHLDNLNNSYKRSDFDQNIYDKLVEKEKKELEKVNKEKNKASDVIKAEYGLSPDDLTPSVDTFDLFRSHKKGYDGSLLPSLEINPLIRKLYEVQKSLFFIDKIIKSDEGGKLGINDSIKSFDEKVKEMIKDLGSQLQKIGLTDIVDGDTKDSTKNLVFDNSNFLDLKKALVIKFTQLKIKIDGKEKTFAQIISELDNDLIMPKKVYELLTTHKNNEVKFKEEFNKLSLNKNLQIVQEEINQEKLAKFKEFCEALKSQFAQSDFYKKFVNDIQGIKVCQSLLKELISNKDEIIKKIDVLVEWAEKEFNQKMQTIKTAWETIKKDYGEDIDLCSNFLNTDNLWKGKNVKDILKNSIQEKYKKKNPELSKVDGSAKVDKTNEEGIRKQAEYKNDLKQYQQNKQAFENIINTALCQQMPFESSNIFQTQISNFEMQEKVNKIYNDLNTKYKNFFHDLYPKIATEYEKFVTQINNKLQLKREEYDHIYYDSTKPRLTYMLENNQKLRDFLIYGVKQKIIEHFKYHYCYAELTLSPSKVVSNVYNVIEPFSIYCHRNKVDIKAFQDKNTVWMHSITEKGDAGDIFYINNSGGHYEKLVKPLDEKQKVWYNLWQHAESLRQILMY